MLKYTESLTKNEYRIKFDDNKYTMIFKNDDICQILKVYSLIQKRIDDFINKKSNILKTSDIKGLKYIKI